MPSRAVGSFTRLRNAPPPRARSRRLPRFGDMHPARRTHPPQPISIGRDDAAPRGRALAAGAHFSPLRRTASGWYTAQRSIPRTRRRGRAIAFTRPLPRTTMCVTTSPPPVHAAPCFRRILALRFGHVPRHTPHPSAAARIRRPGYPYSARPCVGPFAQRSPRPAGSTRHRYHAWGRRCPFLVPCPEPLPVHRTALHPPHPPRGRALAFAPPLPRTAMCGTATPRPFTLPPAFDASSRCALGMCHAAHRTHLQPVSMGRHDANPRSRTLAGLCTATPPSHLAHPGRLAAASSAVSHAAGDMRAQKN